MDRGRAASNFLKRVRVCICKLLFYCVFLIYRVFVLVEMGRPLGSMIAIYSVLETQRFEACTASVCMSCNCCQNIHARREQCLYFRPLPCAPI